MKVVQLKKPQESRNIAQSFRDLAKRADNGDFDSVFIFAFKPDKTFLTREVGKPNSRLEVIGMIETMKSDLISTMDQSAVVTDLSDA